MRDAPAADAFDLILAEVTPRTRLLATSAVSWIDGKVLPWHELRDVTQIPILIDGAQSVGALEVDATGADFYTVSAQKWLCGPDATRCAVRRRPRHPAASSRRVPERRVVRHRRRQLGAEVQARARFDTSFLPGVVPRGLEVALGDLPEGRFDPCAAAHGAVPGPAGRPGP